MRGLRTAAVVCVLATAYPAVAQDAPQPVALRARSDGGMGGRPVVIAVAADGAATVELPAIGTPARVPLVRTSFRLSSGDMDQLRDLVGQARFLAEWGPGGSRMHATTWDVTVVLGAHERRRERICSQPEFEPLERYLWRFVHQVETVERVRDGGAIWVAESLDREEERARLVRPEANVEELVPALAREAGDSERARNAYEPARHLARLAEPADGAARLAEILARAEGERRDAVLSAWVEEVKRAGRAAHRRTFDPIALAE